MMPFVLGVEEVFEPALWVHLVLWGTLLPIACPRPAAALSRVRSSGLQWATMMHGFGEGEAKGRRLSQARPAPSALGTRRARSGVGYADTLSLERSRWA
jgi:hypothetical protein